MCQLKNWLNIWKCHTIVLKMSSKHYFLSSDTILMPFQSVVLLAPGILSCWKVSTTHLKFGHPWMKTTDYESSNEFQWLGLTHWGRVTHICVSKLTTIGSDNGLSPGRRQAIIWTNAGILLIGPLGTDFSEILIEILTFSFKKMHLKLSSAKRRPFCLGLNVLRIGHQDSYTSNGC